MSRFLIRSLFVSSAGATGFYGVVLLNYGFELLQRFAMLLVVVVGFWVGGWLFLILRLQKSERAVVRGIGEALGTGMMYTSLFQGILYTVLVFMVLGYTAGGVELPDSRTAFVTDFLFGAAYLAALIFGASGATVFFTHHGMRTRVLAILYGAVGVAVPVTILVTGGFAEQVERNVVLALVNCLGFSLVLSYLLMTLLAAPEDPLAKRKAEIRSRLKKKGR